MSVRFVTGLAAALRERLSAELAGSLRDPGDTLVIVPGQLTLDTERFALDVSGLPGSFRLKVLSPARLYEYVFAQTGACLDAQVDERGRAMLTKRALDETDEPLTAFERARRGPGFAPLAAKEIALCKEAGLTPDALREMANTRAGTPLAGKLSDIATLYAAYEARLQGVGLDEEDAQRVALMRLPQAKSLRTARVWFYGFDLLTLPIARSIAALGAVASQTTVCLALRANASARDWRLYEPVQRSYERVLALLRDSGVPYSREALDETRDPADEMRALSEELYCYPAQGIKTAPERVTLWACRNPRDEAEHTAASIRDLVRRKRWRYSDIAVAYQSSGAMYAPLRRAFALYDIPVFFSESRPASAHPLGATLTAALRIAAKRPTEEDIQTLLSLGYMSVDPDDADFLRNFAVQKGITGARWLREYRLRDEADAEGARFESVRRPWVQPILALRAGLKAPATRDRVNAVYAYMRDAGLYEAMMRAADAVSAEGFPVEASEGAQVWNRALDALDQMDSLFGAEKPPAGASLCDMIDAAMRATDIKPLPQSADAVSAGVLQHMKTRPVRALFLVGATDADEPAAISLLMETELEELSKECWLEPDRSERARMRMLAAKTCLGFATERVSVSWHESAADGSACRPGALARGIRGICPMVQVKGGVRYDPAETALRLNHPRAAALRAGEGLTEEGAPRPEEARAIRALRELPDNDRLLTAFASALGGERMPGSIPSHIAGSLYSGPRSVSVSRLERFASCPLRHFIDYGARPVENREYGIDPRDRGQVFHEAMERFASEGEEPDIDRAIERMDRITAELTSKYLPGFVDNGAIEQSEADDLRAIARGAARTYVSQTANSRFRPAAQEADFRAGTALRLGDCLLEGRIDRVDLLRGQDGSHLRVIDYKSGENRLDLARVYYGLQLQLIVYLLAAMGMYGADPAALLYFRIADPLIDSRSVSEEEVAAERTKKTRMDGLLLEDADLVRAMADPPESALPVTFNKDGALRKSDKLLSNEDFLLLAQRALSQAERSLRGIREGDVAARPAVLGQENACRFCPYAAICRLDPSGHTVQQEKYKTLKAEEVLTRLREPADSDNTEFSND